MNRRTRPLIILLVAALLLSQLAGCGGPKRAKETDEVTVGIDVARYQGTIDWALAAKDVDFVMVRLGYRTQEDGKIVEDSNARYNLQEASANGVKLGAYFFSSAVTEEEAIEEANWVADLLDRYPITYPVAYNCEGYDQPDHRNYRLSKSERTDLALALLKTIEERGYEGMFYASKNEMEHDVKWEVSRIEGDYKVWVAQYPDPPYPQTPISTYSGEYQMWQYTREGTVSGISQPVDMDVAFFGYEGISEPKSEEPPEKAYPDPEALLDFKAVSETVTAKIEVNLRTLPSQGEDSSVVHLLKNGETAVRTGISDTGWSRLEYGGRVCYAVSSMLTTDLDYDPQKDGESGTGTDGDGDGLVTEFTAVDDVVTAKEAVNLRSMPSTEHPDVVVVYQLKRGETVRRTGIDEKWGWSRLVYRGQVCYAVTSLLTTDLGDDPVDVSEKEVIEVTMQFTEVHEEVTARIRVNLRNMPSTEDPRSQVVYELLNGDVAIRTGVAKQGEWARVEYNGQVLYCINNYLMKVE